MRKIITYDNESENVQHMDINNVLGTQSYFCNPFHSWGKGSVENVIGLVRIFLPKSTDFAIITKERLQRKILLMNVLASAWVTKPRMRTLPQVLRFTVECGDLNEDTINQNIKEVYFSGDAHWNANAHKFVGVMLAKYITSKYLVNKGQ